MSRQTLLFACLVLMMTSCKSEAVCDTLAKRNATCADAFVEEAKRRARDGMLERTATLPAQARARAMAEMEAGFEKSAKDVRETLTSDEFRTDCRRDWDNPAKMPEALKQELSRCLKLTDCASYAKCFIESAALSP
jgi:hypothetical protein